MLQDAGIPHTSFVKGLGHNLPVNVSDSLQMLSSRANPECARLHSDIFEVRLHALLRHVQHINWVAPEPMQPEIPIKGTSHLANRKQTKRNGPKG